MTATTRYDFAGIGGGNFQETTMISGRDRQKTVVQGHTKVLFFSSDASHTDIVRLDQGRIYQVDDKRKAPIVTQFVIEAAGEPAPAASTLPEPPRRGSAVLFRFTNEITSLSTKAPAASEFEPPKGYREG